MERMFRIDETIGEDQIGNRIVNSEYTTIV